MASLRLAAPAWRLTLARRAFSTSALARIAANESHAYTEHEKPGYGIKTSFLERAFLGLGSSLGLLARPSRGDLLTVLTQVSSFSAIDRLIGQMQSTHEGRCLMITRPSINSSTIDLDALWRLDDGTFGKEWVRWLHANHIGPDGRCDARFMPTIESRYAIQRYRETHDFYHVLLGMPTSTLGETVVKYFEMAHMHLPVAALSVVGGSVRVLNDDLTKKDASHAAAQLRLLAPWAWRLGKNVRVPLITVAWEQRWAQPLAEMREEFGLHVPAPVELDATQRPRSSVKTQTQVAGRRFYGWPSKIWERHGQKDARHK
ncbi:Coq4p [Malassezia vespertilionis]|uniref:4-hydroxy-3-methoxy-5-polyprenylbenzoate decarboxylase n=2 Tax=Malassezia vespertilionis TaxID=2020962 RepID=A0A2N1JFY1_9BASI|nr:Coq4p [Malassezia vespertilionis]